MTCQLFSKPYTACSDFWRKCLATIQHVTVKGVNQRRETSSYPKQGNEQMTQFPSPLTFIQLPLTFSSSSGNRHRPLPFLSGFCTCKGLQQASTIPPQRLNMASFMSNFHEQVQGYLPSQRPTSCTIFRFLHVFLREFLIKNKLHRHATATYQYHPTTLQVNQ